jgi:hypothetical protein
MASRAVFALNVPGFLVAWFSRGGTMVVESLQLIAVNWFCWSAVCTPVTMAWKGR